MNTRQDAHCLGKLRGLLPPASHSWHFAGQCMLLVHVHSPRGLARSLRSGLHLPPRNAPGRLEDIRTQEFFFSNSTDCHLLKCDICSRLFNIGWCLSGRGYVTGKLYRTSRLACLILFVSFIVQFERNLLHQKLPTAWKRQTFHTDYANASPCNFSSAFRCLSMHRICPCNTKK